MPSSHHRVGLVADHPVRDALETVRRVNAGTSWPEARVAREAVFDGAFFEALRDAVAATGTGADEARAVLRTLSDLLPSLDLSAEIKSVIAARMEQTLGRVDDDERRRRQLQLLASPDPYGEAALAIADEFDEVDELAHLPG